ncbi:MAG: cadherin-like domain-containing protein, partial [Rhodopirellula sp.]|nr:cadherin-like domain-containing protein [Rhodopirellula sp.]
IRGMQFKAAAGVFGGPETFGFAVADNGTTDGLTDSKTLVRTIAINVTESTPDPVTLEVRVASSSDDAEEQPSGSVDLNSSDLELTLDKTDQQTVGMRFNGVDIPPGALIQSAYLQLQADETGSAATSLRIYGQANDNATTFTSTGGNISSRVKTTASVPWSPAAWNVRSEAGLNQRTPDLAAVIQEIVDRPGWAAGNSLALIVTGTGTRTAESFDGLPSAAPLLHVEYLPGGSVPPVNKAPAAVNDTVTTSPAAPVTTQVLINDVLGDLPTAITSVTQGDNGIATFDGAAGTTTYTPSGNFIGTDSYTYTITDANGDTSTAMVQVTITDTAALSPVVFRVMGDVPYSNGELSEVEADLANVGAADAFFVHVGDITSGSGPWGESVYTSMASTLETSSKPVFILPGDNEWNDSPDPDQAWSYWEDHLLRLEENWSSSFTVLRQSVREENFAFVQSGVLFVGINLVGGSVHDADEWSQRMTDDANWVTENFNNFGSQITSAVVFGHAFPDPTGDDRQQFGRDFVAAAQDFGKPVLYMMGDEHHWLLDHPYNDAPNVTRVIVDQGVPSVRVTVTHDPTNPFNFDRSP